jgi:filamentous hemagglutinin family protein
MHMGRSHGKALRKKVAFLMVVVFWGYQLMLCSPAFAGPQGGVVTSGGAVINQSGAVTNIDQSTNKASINWQSFGTKPNETVNFNQPSAAAMTLNRVIGNERSVLEGALNATGRVFLINSNGILMTGTSSVNTAGFVASTLDIDDEDFKNGKYLFRANGSRNSVINMGTITTPGGYLALLGNNVSNQGVISAIKGTVALASGDKISLNFNGDSLVGVTVDEGTLNALVENKGAIYADGGKVILTAKAADELLSAQVNNTGLIQARTIDDLKGDIKLLAAGGTTNVDGTLDASAPNGGNGGFIETSGDKVKVADTAIVTTASADGQNGTWLIDPDGFTIGTNSADGDMTGTALASALTRGNVTIASTSGSGSDGNIDVNGAVSWSANTLTLNATNNIFVNNVMTATGTAGFAASHGKGTNGDGTPNGLYCYQGTNPLISYAGSINFSGSGVTLNGEAYKVINNATDLAAVNADLAGNYVLGGSFGDYATTTFTSAIGDTTAFTGNFNGFGHTIANKGTTATGLFGTIGEGAVISNLGVSITTVSAAASGANRVPAVGILAGNNQGKIINSFASGVLNNSNITSAGGLVGINSGLIAQSSFTGRVYAIDVAGGLVGTNAAGGTIIDSSARATTNIQYVTNTSGATGISYVGGLVGVNEDGGTIGRSYAGNLVKLTDANSIAGVFVGKNAGAIDQSYAAIKGTDPNYTGPRLAGFVGENTSTGKITDSYTTALYSTGASSSNWIAGFVYKNAGTIENAYATSYSANTLSSSRYGFAYENTGKISNAHWYAAAAEGATTPTDGSPAKQLDAARAAAFSSYTGFNSDIWGASTAGAPVLRNMLVYFGTSSAPTYGDATSNVGSLGLSVLGLQGGDGFASIWDPVTQTFSNPWIVKTDNGYVDAGTRDVSEVISSPVYKTIKGTVTVVPKTLTVSGVVEDKTYDGTTNATLMTNVANNGLVGLVGSQTLGIDYTGAAFADKNAGTGKTVNITYGSLTDGTNGGKASNYTLTTTTTTASIAKKPIGTTFTADSKNYDGTTTATISSGSTNGVVSGDTVSLNYNTTGAFDNANAGTGKTVTVSGISLTGTDSGNYTTDASGATTATVSPLALELYGTKASDDGNTTVSGSNISATNLVGRDTVTFTGSATIADTTPGVRQMIIDPNTLTVDNPNYTVVGSVGRVVVGGTPRVVDKIQGTATIDTSAPNTTTITTSDKAIIDWLRFNVLAGETLEFKQPDSYSIVLNRVTGSEKSVIAGILNSNGRVFILNSNGILFAPNSSVNVGALVATTLNMSDADFNNSNYMFTVAKGNGSIVAKGDIIIANGGFAALASENNVTHTGGLTAPGGNTALFVSADELTLTLNPADSTLTGHTMGALTGTTAVGGRLNVGSATGNGGLVETAGDSVAFAPDSLNTGAGGTWSLTQNDTITIGDGGTLTGDLVGNNLGLRNVSLEARDGDINVNDVVSWSAGTTLTLGAAHDININNKVEALGTNAALIMNYGNDYSILTSASYSGAVRDANGSLVAKQDTSNGVYGSITLSKAHAGLTINGKVYKLIHSMRELDLLDGQDSITGKYYNPVTGVYDLTAPASVVRQEPNSTGKLIDKTYYYNPVTGAYDLTTKSPYMPLSAGYYLALADDLVATGTSATSVVENFAGTLAGLGHTISNLTITSAVGETGLIGTTYAGSLVRDIGLLNVNITGIDANAKDTGSLAGSSYGDVRNAYATGTVTSTGAKTYSGYNTGGLLGTLGGNITSSYTNVKVTGVSNVGGLVGYVNGSIDDSQNVTAGNITGCHAEGDVTGNSYVGGLVGYHYKGYIIDSYATGAVASAAVKSGKTVTVAGGLVGYLNSYGFIRDSFARGAVTGDTSVGGLVGSMSTNANIANVYAFGNVTGVSSVGGLVGTVGFKGAANPYSITNGYAFGNVTGDTAVGGLVGTLSGGFVYDSVASGTVTGRDTNGSIGGLVGYMTFNGYFDALISGCRATGDVINTAQITTAGRDGGTGGLVGYARSETDSVKSTYAKSYIINSVAEGNVTAASTWKSDTSAVAALVGNNSALISGSSATGSVSGPAVPNIVNNLLGKNALPLASPTSTNVTGSTYTDVAGQAAQAAQAAARAAALAAAQAARAAAQNASQQAVTEASAGAQAGRTAGQALQHEANVFADQGGSLVEQHESVGSGIVFAESDSYSAHIKAISVEGEEEYELDDDK